ncbi:unnamed protein product [Calicophoron daubneyi]|uniref:Uncharacterized protein n=1 Tax=Calicophoron daubneyi TaxID=300641 RepID=A0AAV2T0P3_CALDB
MSRSRRKNSNQKRKAGKGVSKSMRKKEKALVEKSLQLLNQHIPVFRSEVIRSADCLKVGNADSVSHVRQDELYFFIHPLTPYPSLRMLVIVLWAIGRHQCMLNALWLLTGLGTRPVRWPRTSDLQNYLLSF